MTGGTPECRFFGWESGLANYVSATAEDRASLVRRLVRLQPDELYSV